LTVRMRAMMRVRVLRVRMRVMVRLWVRLLLN
jgi:hypothetical protein